MKHDPAGHHVSRAELLQAFGMRLRQERIRLGLTQKQMATIGGVKRGSQILYEKGACAPSLIYVGLVVDAGVEVPKLFPSSRKLDQKRSTARNSEASDTISFRRSDIFQALTLADSFCRDRKGRLLDLDLRNAVRLKVFELVAKQYPGEVDWKAISKSLSKRPAPK